MVRNRILHCTAALSLAVVAVWSLAPGAPSVGRPRGPHATHVRLHSHIFPLATLQAIDDDDTHAAAAQSSDDDNHSAAAWPVSSQNRLYRPMSTALLLPADSNLLRPGHARLWPFPRSPSA
jgi:hypothetical protein